MVVRQLCIDGRGVAGSEFSAAGNSKSETWCYTRASAITVRSRPRSASGTSRRPPRRSLRNNMHRYPSCQRYCGLHRLAFACHGSSLQRELMNRISARCSGPIRKMARASREAVSRFGRLSPALRRRHCRKLADRPGSPVDRLSGDRRARHIHRDLPRRHPQRRLCRQRALRRSWGLNSGASDELGEQRWRGQGATSASSGRPRLRQAGWLRPRGRILR